MIRSVLAEDGRFVQKDSYLLTSLTKACQLQNDVVINRFPIHKDLLYLILNETEKLFNQQPYLEILYKALFISAYYGLLRAGEVTQGPHVVLANNVHIGLNKDKILFILRTSKTHTADSKPQMIKFNRIKAVAKPLNSPSASHSTKFHYQTKHCPFDTLKKYITARPPAISDVEQFFIFRDRSPVKAEQMRSTLRKLLVKANLQAHLYNLHSFRIGHCGDLLKLGVSV